MAALAFSGAASASDPGAPAGAAPTWLPSQAWVLDHWLPYDETRLWTVLGMSRSGVLGWLGAHGDHASLLELARERGVPSAGLAQRLVGPRPAGMALATYRMRVAHAQLTLTQPHLSHHILGHVMHVIALLHAMPAIFGYPSIKQIMALHQQGLSFDQIGSRQHVAASVLRTKIMAVLTATGQRGLRAGATPAAQEISWLSRQRLGLDRWLSNAPPNLAAAQLHNGALAPDAVWSDGSRLPVSLLSHATRLPVTLLCHLL